MSHTSPTRRSLMSEQVKNPFDLLLDQIRLVVSEEIQKGLSEKRSPKLLFNTKEASAMLGVDESWLAAKARAGSVPCRMLGHYRYFSSADIQMIIDTHYVPGVQSSHDGKRASADSKAPGVEPVPTRGSNGNNGD